MTETREARCRYCRAGVSMARDGSPYHVLEYFEGHEREHIVCQELLHKADAALASLPSCEGWRGIESAPRDGTVFLAYDTPTNGVSCGIILCHWDDEEGYDHDEWPPGWRFTDLSGDCALGCDVRHWMPLPSPPDTSATVPPPESGCEAAVLAERERCARIAETRWKRWKMPHPDDARSGEVCDDVSACVDIAAAIRADGREG